MPPKAEITKKRIVEAAFEIVREEGMEALTARRIAQRLKCSTQPIYSVYGNMEALIDDVYSMVVDFALTSMESYKNVKNEHAMNLAMGCLLFAKNERQLFRAAYLSDHRSRYVMKDTDKLNERLYTAFMRMDMHRTVAESKLKQIFLKISIFLIGIGAMINSNNLELDINEATAMIEEMYEALLLKEGITL